MKKVHFDLKTDGAAVLLDFLLSLALPYKNKSVFKNRQKMPEMIGFWFQHLCISGEFLSDISLFQ